MAYQLRNEKGVPFKKKGKDVLATSVNVNKLMELDEKNLTFIAVASTEDEDRDKDIVRQSGWKMVNFKKNPVVPWSHDYYGVPVARSMKTWVDKTTNRLLFKPKFDAEDGESVKIFNKYKNGFLSTFSVGFMGIKFDYRDEEDKWWGGREFTEQELLEISCCAVPANPNANVHVGGDKVAESLLTMGYTQYFSKTESGLFYPVNDIAVFTQPKEFEIAEGVTAIKAVPLDEDLEVKDPVAYLFDPDQFDDKTANEWIKENVEQERKVKYFDLKVDKKGSISVDAVEEVVPIKLFEESVQVHSVDTQDNDTDTDDQDKDLSLEDGAQDLDADENKVPDDSDDKSDASDNDKTTDASDTNGDGTDADQADDSAKGTQADQTVVVLSRSIEISKVLKDMDGNIIDERIIRVGTNAEISTIAEYEEMEANQLISLLKAEIAELKKSIAELSNKKDLDNPNEITDTVDNKTDDLEDKDDSTSKNDDLIELDSSLTSPANEKTNSDTDEIEIDEDMFNSSKSTVGETVKSSLAEILREKLSEAISDLSGKID